MERAFAVSSINVAPQVVMAPSSLRAPLPQKASATNGSFHMASGAAVSACALALATGGRASAGKRRLARGQALCRSAVGTIATGQRVQWNGVAGVVQFVGEVSFAAGEWIGVPLRLQAMLLARRCHGRATLVLCSLWGRLPLLPTQ